MMLNTFRRLFMVSDLTRFILFVILLTTLAACNMESRQLNEQTRKDLGKTFVKLPAGFVHFQLGGPVDGQVVVLVHGFTSPLFIWDNTYPALIEAGFRVLRYDLFGRGYSDRPKDTYNEDLFDRQLIDLFSALNIDTPVHLVGLSMGGAISVVFTSRHPEKVGRLVLIDPAGFPIDIPVAAKILKTPFLGAPLMKMFGDRVILKKIKGNMYNQELVPAFKEKFIRQMQYKGYKNAIMNTMIHFDLLDQQKAYQNVGSQKRPVQLFWGTEDNVIPFDNSKLVCKAIPHTQFNPIKQAGHIPHYEKASEVNKLMVDFLQN